MACLGFLEAVVGFLKLPKSILDKIKWLL